MANNKFFKSLPADELTPMEHALRKALVKAVRSMGGKPFPLVEWIDRRIGGEIESVQGESGCMEARMRGEGGDTAAQPRGATPGAGPEAFFASLSADSFDAAEEALREAVFEFLATWSSPQLASLTQMQQYPEVQRRAKAFLPRNIQLKDWIEHRIGAEIEFRPGPRGSPEVVHLTEHARASVMAKFQQMSAHSMGMPPVGPPPPMGGMGGMPLPPHGGLPPPPMGSPSLDKDQFFATLPGDELLPGELALREAILAWIHRVARDTTRRGTPLHLSDAGGEMEIKRARQELLPPKVKLSDWIERRVGGEVELRAVANGQHEVFLRGQAPPAAAARGGAGGAGGAGPPGEAKVASAEEKEKFFTALPDDEFSDAEDNLRAALLDFIERWTGQGHPAVSDLQSEEDVQAAKKELLPKGCKVGLKDWIDRRIGGEIETRAQPGGNWVFGIRGSLSNKKRRME